MSATKVRGRDRQETSVAASLSIWVRLYRTLIAWQGVRGSNFGKQISCARSQIKDGPSQIQEGQGPSRTPHASRGNDLRSQAPLDSGVAEDAARDLFDRAFRRVDHGNGIAREKGFRRARLVRTCWREA